jgi:hypothetical protein
MTLIETMGTVDPLHTDSLYSDRPVISKAESVAQGWMVSSRAKVSEPLWTLDKQKKWTTGRLTNTVERTATRRRDYRGRI